MYPTTPLSQPSDLHELLHDLAEYMESREDCDDGRPNEAMRLHTRIRHEINLIERAKRQRAEIRRLSELRKGEAA